MITIHLDLEKLKELSLTVNHLMVLLRTAYPEIIVLASPTLVLELCEKGLIELEKGKFQLTEEGTEVVSVFTNPPVRELDELANTLRDIYPLGKKGDTYYWRGSQSEIAWKLKIFFKKHKDYTHQDVIDATRRYVESFKDSRTRDKAMMLLKYFIEKKGMSTLSDHIENVKETKDLKIDYGNTRQL